MGPNQVLPFRDSVDQGFNGNEEPLYILHILNLTTERSLMLYPRQEFLVYVCGESFF